jgi:hypothetical protein
VVSSSSTKKAARLAQKGKGKRVRFQGGTLFPMVILAILVIGLGVIVYARSSVPAADASPPTSEDHWHIAYGFSLCDQPGEFIQLDGNLESPGTPGFTDYQRTGVHSHDDGVIHWHPFTSASVGKRADLGLFLENYGVELTDDTLRFPEGQNPNGLQEYIEGETECPDGKDGELSVTVWQSPEDGSNGDTYISDFGDIRISKNSLVMTIAFQPRGTDIEKPPWAAQLEQLGAIDMGQTAPSDTTPTGSTTPGSAPASTSPTGSTVTGEPSDATTTTAAATTTTTTG